MPCRPLLSPQTMAVKRIFLPSSLATVAFTVFTLLPIAAVTAHVVPVQQAKLGNYPKPPLMLPMMGNKINQPNPKPNTNGKPTLMPPTVTAKATVKAKGSLTMPKQGNDGASPLPKKPPMPLNKINQPKPNTNANGKPTTMPPKPTATGTTKEMEMDQQAINEYLSGHNKARAALGLKPLTWNSTLANVAKQWATTRKVDCALTHSLGDEYGENLYWAKTPNWTPGMAVKLWVDEMFDYDPRSNSCAHKKMCGHYTQIVWKDTTSVGCAKVSCHKNKGLFVACNYYPPGNYINEHPFGPNKADVEQYIKKFQASKLLNINKSTKTP